MQVEFLIIIASIIASAFFSGMEIAFVSSNKLRIALNKQQGLFYAKILSLKINSPSKYLYLCIMMHTYVYFMHILSRFMHRYTYLGINSYIHLYINLYIPLPLFSLCWALYIYSPNSL